MTLKGRILHALAAIERTSDTANRVHRAFMRGAARRGSTDSAKEYIHEVYSQHHDIGPLRATQDGSCATILIDGVRAYAMPDGDLTSQVKTRFSLALAVMHHIACQRYREPRPGGVVRLAEDIAWHAEDGDDPVDLILKHAAGILSGDQPDERYPWPDPGVECVFRFFNALKETA